MSHKALIIHVFALLLALSEVNDNLGDQHFDALEAICTMLGSIILFSRKPINNPYLRHDILT